MPVQYAAETIQFHNLTATSDAKKGFTQKNVCDLMDGKGV